MTCIHIPGPTHFLPGPAELVMVKSHAEVGVARVWLSTYIAQLVDSMQYVAGLSLT